MTTQGASCVPVPFTAKLMPVAALSAAAIAGASALPAIAPVVLPPKLSVKALVSWCSTLKMLSVRPMGGVIPRLPLAALSPGVVPSEVKTISYGCRQARWPR